MKPKSSIVLDLKSATEKPRNFGRSECEVTTFTLNAVRLKSIVMQKEVNLSFVHLDDSYYANRIVNSLVTSEC